MKARKSVIIAVLLMLVIAAPVVAQSIAVGGKGNPELDVGGFAELYISPYFSLGLSLVTQVQTPSVGIDSVQATAKFYSPNYMSTFAFYGGGGARLKFAGNSRQTFALLLLGMKINPGVGLNLLGELNLVSPLEDLQRFYLETWIGAEVRFNL